MIVKRRIELWTSDTLWGWRRGDCHWREYDVWCLFGIIPLYIREVVD